MLKILKKYITRLLTSTLYVIIENNLVVRLLTIPDCQDHIRGDHSNDRTQSSGPIAHDSGLSISYKGRSL